MGLAELDRVPGKPLVAINSRAGRCDPASPTGLHSGGSYGVERSREDDRSEITRRSVEVSPNPGRARKEQRNTHARNCYRPRNRDAGESGCSESLDIDLFE